MNGQFLLKFLGCLVPHRSNPVDFFFTLTSFHIYIHPWNHHQSQNNEHIHHSQSISPALLEHLPSPLPASHPRQLLLCCHSSSYFLEFYRNAIIQYVLFPPSPASFIQKNYSEIHLCCSIYQIFITFYCIMVFHRKHIFYCTFKYSAADGHLGFLLAGGYYK